MQYYFFGREISLVFIGGSTLNSVGTLTLKYYTYYHMIQILKPDSITSKQRIQSCPIPATVKDKINDANNSNR